MLLWWIQNKKLSKIGLCTCSWKINEGRASPATSGTNKHENSFNLFSTGSIKKLHFWDSSNSTNFKRQQVRNHKWKIWSICISLETLSNALSKTLWGDNICSYLFLKYCYSKVEGIGTHIACSREQKGEINCEKKLYEKNDEGESFDDIIRNIIKEEFETHESK